MWSILEVFNSFWKFNCRIFIEDAHLQDRLNSSDCRVFGQLRNIDQYKSSARLIIFLERGVLLISPSWPYEHLLFWKVRKPNFWGQNPFSSNDTISTDNKRWFFRIYLEIRLISIVSKPIKIAKLSLNT